MSACPSFMRLSPRDRVEWAKEQIMPWQVDLAVKHAQTHAEPHSTSQCAKYTRQAIEAGGVTLQRHGSAKDYGASLVKIGFMALESNASYKPIQGDVVVISSFKGHPHGHMAIFDGKQWISDFKQRTLYPGNAYRKAKPAFKVYRYRVLWDGLMRPGLLQAFA